MTWKTVINADAGDADHYGGNDLDKLFNSLNGSNVSEPIIFNISYNTLKDTTNAAGDLLKGDGTKFIRLAKGTANQVLTVNGSATDIQWSNPTIASGGYDSTQASTTWKSTASGNIGFELGSNHATGGDFYIDFHTNSELRIL